MPQTTLLRLMCAGLLLLTALVNHALPRLPAPRLRVVPIARLPRQIGAWTCTEDLPIEDNVRAALSQAALLSRVYRDGSGRTVRLLLETSADPEMFHSPLSCVPSANANIVQIRHLQLSAAASAASANKIATVSATEMRLEGQGQTMLLLYWYTSERQLDKWQALKNKVVAGRAPTRLYARILVPTVANVEVAAQTAQDFAQAIRPRLAELENP